ncbi:MAG TPA: maleylpyruvate isomerase family mycothiol-dependent enzyme [Micromonosporaceae bacterium]
MSRVQSKPGKEFWLAALRHEGAAFRAAVSLEGLTEPVPTCPDWTVEDLVIHLGGVYQWVHGHVTREVITRPERPSTDGVPRGEPALSWWDDRYGELLSTLDRLDAELPAWNWAPQEKKAGFWHRRMAHETAVHRWDAQVAAGLTEPVETKLAVDGVSEVLDSWLPGGRRRSVDGRVSGMVQLVASDVAHAWLVRIRGAGVALLDTSTVMHEPHKIDAQAVGTASDLQLALWGRVPFDVLETAGNTRLLEALRTG